MIGIDDVRRAGDVVGAHLSPTPIVRPAELAHVTMVDVVLALECTQPTGSFKVRGGVHLASLLTDAERRAGLVTNSTGNHAQSVAHAAQLADTTAVVVMPDSAPEVKRRAVEALGARVVVHGPTMTEAGERARRFASEEGRRYVDPAEEAIVLGHATTYLDLFTAHPDLDVLYVPIGSGTGAAGACVVRDALAPACRVVGVQSEAAPAAYRSWRARELLTAPCTTRVSGLATAMAFALPQSILVDRLDDFLLVADDAVHAAASLLHRHADVVAEGAGAAALAGLLGDPQRRSGAVVGIPITGGNASAEERAALGV